MSDAGGFGSAGGDGGISAGDSGDVNAAGTEALDNPTTNFSEVGRGNDDTVTNFSEVGEADDSSENTNYTRPRLETNGINVPPV